MTVVLDDSDGTPVECHDRDDFIAQTMAYRYSKAYRDLLTSQWLQQKTPAEAIAYIREQAGAVTLEEKSAAKRAVGRPRSVLTLIELQRKVALAVVKVVIESEARLMDEETRKALESVKRQALQQLGGA